MFCFILYALQIIKYFETLIVNPKFRFQIQNIIFEFFKLPQTGTFDGGGVNWNNFGFSL